MSWGRFCTTVNHTLFEYPSLRKFVEDLEILTQITANLDYVIYINSYQTLI